VLCTNVRDEHLRKRFGRSPFLHDSQKTLNETANAISKRANDRHLVVPPIYRPRRSVHERHRRRAQGDQLCLVYNKIHRNNLVSQ
jgi:hypothetical protein